MKFFILLIIGMAPIMQATVFEIKLSPNFVKYDGKYLFTMDIEGKLKNKIWHLIIKDGNVTIQPHKGLEGQSLKLDKKTNKITVKSGVMKSKKANELEILVEQSDYFGIGSIVRTGLAKASKKFTVDVGPGLGLMIPSAKKPKNYKDCTYGLTGTNLPDGDYTLKLVIPAAQDKIYKFNVVNGTIATMLAGTDKSGNLEKGSLVIDAHAMCAFRRSKKAITGLGVGIPVAIGTAAAMIYSPGVAHGISFCLEKMGTIVEGAAPDLLETQEKALANVAEFAARKSLSVAGTLGKLAGKMGAATSGIVGIGVVSGVLSGGIRGGVAAVNLGNRQATAQITYDSGMWQGDRTAKLDYDECRNNVFVLYKSEEKINIKQK